MRKYGRAFVSTLCLSFSEDDSGGLLRDRVEVLGTGGLDCGLPACTLSQLSFLGPAGSQLVSEAFVQSRPF